jgi:CMP-N-acetylneuraminic acid synthetase
MENKYINKVAISSDSQEIFNCIQQIYQDKIFKIERPKIISGDFSLDIDYIKHALLWMKEEFDLIALLQPTTVFRDHKIVEEAFKVFFNLKEHTSLMSAHMDNSPYKMIKRYPAGTISSVIPILSKEQWTHPRQSFPRDLFMPNGYIDILRPEVIWKTDSLYGDFPFIYETPEPIDLNTLDDWGRATSILRNM